MPFGHFDRPFCLPRGSMLIQAIKTNHPHSFHQTKLDIPFGHFHRPFCPARSAWVQFSFKNSRPLMQTYATKDNLTCPSGTSTVHFALPEGHGLNSHSRTVDHSCKLMPLKTT